MKNRAVCRFREQLECEELLVGLQVTLEPGAISDIAAGLGLDWLLLDNFGSQPDLRALTGSIHATQRCDTVVLVSVRESSPTSIAWILDAGADGVVLPSSLSPSQLSAAIASIKSAHVSSITDRTFRSIDSPVGEAICHPIIFVDLPEGASPSLLEYGECAAEIDAVLFHPSSSSSKAVTLLDDRVSPITSHLEETIASVRMHGLKPAAIADSEDKVLQLRAKGVQLIGLGTDLEILASALQARLDVAEQLRPSSGSVELIANCSPEMRRN